MLCSIKPPGGWTWSDWRGVIFPGRGGYGPVGPRNPEPGVLLSDQQQQPSKTNWTSSATYALRDKKRLDLQPIKCTYILTDATAILEKAKMINVLWA